MNSNVSRRRSRQFRHTEQARDASDVITYPLIQEKFALLESDLEGEIGGKISELISSRNKSEKGIAKIRLITIMRFPR
jgi:hypothetical protein